jgi:tetratricopeptide (TPR) repeat protein
LANDSLDFVQRGKVSIVRRQYAEAVKICRLGLLAHPTLLEGRLVLGMALTALGRWDEVLAEMRVALEVDPVNALAWLLKGEALVGKGDFAQAEGTLKRAKELDPSNTKADQLLAEISVARAAGFEGVPAEPTDTKVYPAKVADGADPKVAEAARRLTSGSVADLPEGTGEHEVEYDDEATDVDPDPSERIRVAEAEARSRRSALQAAVRGSNVAPLPKLSSDDNEEEKEDSSTDLYLPPRGGMEASYEPPAADDYAERARPPVMSHAAGGSTLSEEPSIPGVETRTPIELHRPHRVARRAVDGMPNSTPPLGARATQFDSSEPSIELSGVDLLAVESAPGKSFDVSDEDEQEQEEDTHERKKRQVDPEAGTRPETPEPVVHRQKPLRPFDPSPEAASPLPRPGQKRESRIPVWGDNVVETGHRNNPNPMLDQTGGAPGVVRVPLSPTSKRPAVETPSFMGRVRYALFGDRNSSGLALFGAALIAVIAAGVLSGLFVREYRMRQRVARRYELAKQKLQSGNYPGFQAAELLYRQILQERDDPQARALRARTLAQMSFEFGDSTDGAQRAVTGLGETDTSTEAQEARVYLAMARGELDLAGRLATALRRKSSDASSSYLVGRAELLLERPESAADALRGAAEQETKDSMIQHGLGLAEAAAGHDDRAQEAYRKALEENANHIATLIDRAVLQIRRATPDANGKPSSELESVRSTLDGVVEKLAGDSSPGQMSRAFLALGELELQRGDVEAARKALASSLAKRREGDFLLSEELAQALARSFELDAAEKEAKRAVAGFGGSGRLAPRVTLAKVALARGRPAQALQIVEEAGTSKAEALVLRAEAQLQLGKRDAARNDAEAALRVQPDLVDAKVELARVDITDGHAERAQHELDRLERGVKLPDVAETLGDVFVSWHWQDRARYWYTEAIKRDPLDVGARLKMARLEREAGKPDEARADLEKLLMLNPQYVPARREQAQLLLESGDLQAARDQFDRLADQAEDAETLMGAARAHLYAGDGAGAEERLKKASAAATGPMAEELADLTARAYLLQHRPEDAVALLKKLAPTAQRAETGALLMQAYLDLDQHDNAAKVPLILPPRLRNTPELQTERARLQVERGRDALAEEIAYSAIVRINPPQPKGAPPRPPSARSIARRWVLAEAYVALGRSQYDQGMFRASIKSLKLATELDPTNARAFYHYAFVLEEVKRMPEAREAMERAVRIDPRYPDALYNLGRMRAAAGDPKSRETFAKYLEVSPKGIYAADARRALESDVTPTSSRPRKRRRGR